MSHCSPSPGCILPPEKLECEYCWLSHQYDYYKDQFGNCFNQLTNDQYEREELGAPMYWIGIYVAAASLILCLAMAADVVRGLHRRKLWFPCKFFTLNSASLTLLAVAMKLPVDLTSSMPGATDQLAKLSSTVFMCTVMGNFLPSLGSMSGRSLVANVAALGIVVITMVVNVCIQLNTYAILLTDFQPIAYAIPYADILVVSHIRVICFMLVQLVLICSSALIVPATKKFLKRQYDEKHKMASNEGSELKENVRKYWMMAESSDPQFVMASSATCFSAGAICFLSAVTLFIAEIRLKPWLEWVEWDSKDYSSTSDYKKSTIAILAIQSFGVLVGTIAPAFRWLTTINFKCSNSYLNAFKIENYWIQMLVEWKESPLGLRIRPQRLKRLVHDIKNVILYACIRVQIVIAVASKIVHLIPIFFVTAVFLLLRKLLPKLIAANLDTSKELDLRRYVLQVDGAEELPNRALKNFSNYVNQFINKAKKQQPKNLMELLEKSAGFKGVAEFDSDEIPPLHSNEPPNCWSMPVATLTSVAIALPNIENEIVDKLLCSVSEGFSYIRLIEKSLGDKGELVNIGNAADVVWLEVELYRQWLDNGLHKMALGREKTEEVLQNFGEIAIKSITEFKKSANGGTDWPVKVIAANSMYRISQTILMDYQGSSKSQTCEELFEQLSVMIADILGPCLTNLPRVISMKCSCSAIEKREESVQEAARLFGETEEILKILQQRELPSLDPDQAAYIDEWRAILKPIIPQASISTSNNEPISSGSGELHIDVE